MDLFGIVGPLGSIIGNCLLAATGLAFAVGSNVSVRHRTARWFWMACWALFLSYYCGVVIEEWLRPGAYLEPDTRLWLTVVGDAGSIAAGLLYACVYRTPQIPLKRAIAYVASPYGALWLAQALYPENKTVRDTVFLVSETLNAVFFLLIGWSVRAVHTTSALLLVGYAYLLLPYDRFDETTALLVNAKAYSLLVAAKLALIGVMYKLLDVAAPAKD